MIHIVTAANRHLYEPQLAAMHRLRTVHFVQERNWNLTVREDGGEYDQYDDLRTIYGLAIGKFGQVLAGVRLRPTDDICMLTDDLPQLVAQAPESLTGPDVWELTRLFTTREAREQRKRGGADLKLDLLVAALEYANANGAYRVLCSFTMRDYAAFNRTYASYFPPDRRPARTCIGVTALARDAIVEIDLVARRPGSNAR